MLGCYFGSSIPLTPSIFLNLRVVKFHIFSFSLLALFQVGAYVPAENFELSLVDRIFVRMGANDHIMSGQSTFLTELSETASMLVRMSSV